MYFQVNILSFGTLSFMASNKLQHFVSKNLIKHDMVLLNCLIFISAPKTRVRLSSNPDYINANWIRVNIANSNA